MKKLKNESGSALILALFLMILVSILIVSFSNQVANQIRSTINLDEDIEKMYNTESKIEECIEVFIKSIDIKLENNNYNIGYTGIIENIEVINKDGEKINTVNMTVDTDSQYKQLQENKIEIPSGTNNITFQLEITEDENKESLIQVNISEIDGTSGNVTYKIDYGVQSWRIRN